MTEKRTYASGAIIVHPDRRQVFVDGRHVPLGSRAFDILVALIEYPGEVVSKKRLLELAWGGLAVEENTLTVQMVALRRALGDRDGVPYIQTIRGRGYRFAPLADAGDEASDQTPANGRRSSARGLRYAATAAVVLALFAGASSALLFWPDASHVAAWSAGDPRQAFALVPLTETASEPQLEAYAINFRSDLAGAFTPDMGPERLIVEPSVHEAADFRISLALHRVDEQVRTMVTLTDAAANNVLLTRVIEEPLSATRDPKRAAIMQLRYDLATAALVMEQARVAAKPAAARDAHDLLIAYRCLSTTPECINRFTLVERALILAPNDPHVLGEYANGLSWRVVNGVSTDPAGDLDKASDAAYHVLSAQPHQITALKTLVNIAIARSRWADDLVAVDLILQVDPNNVWALGEQVFALLKLGRIDEAAVPADHALSLSMPANNYFVEELAGLVRFGQGRDTEAIAWLRRAFVADGIDDSDSKERGQILLYIASASALLGNDGDATDALADFGRRFPAVRTITDMRQWSSGLLMVATDRLIAGLRKAGLGAS